jgi:hypothetical protein
MHLIKAIFILKSFEFSLSNLRSWLHLDTVDRINDIHLFYVILYFIIKL